MSNQAELAARSVVQTWPGWRTAAVNTVGQLFLVLQGVVVARSLGPEARGDLGWIQWGPPLIVAIASYGLTQAIPALAGRDEARGKMLFWSAFLAAVVASIVVTLIGCVLYAWGHWPAAHLVAISILFLWSAPLEIVHSFPREFQVMRRNFRAYDLLRLSLSVASCLVLVVLAVGGWLSPASAAVALLAVAAVQAVVAWSVLFPTLVPPHFASRAEFAALMRFGGLCLGAGLAGVLQTRVVQWQVGTAFNADGLGLFLVAVTWGALGGPIWQAVQVRFYSNLSHALPAERRAVFRRAMGTGLALCLVATVVGWAATPWLFPWLMGDKFVEGIPLASACALVAPWQAFATFIGFCIRAIGHAGEAMFLDYVGAVLAIGCAFVVIKFNGGKELVPVGMGVGGLGAVAAGWWIGWRKTAPALAK